MKKIGTLAAALVVMIAAIGMMGCKPEAHVHTFETGWTTDSEYHWHKAKCEHTEEVSDKLLHSYGEWNVTKEATEDAAGSKERPCLVCGYKDIDIIPKKDHVHGTATTWIRTAETHEEKYDCCGAEKTEQSVHTWNHTDYQYDSTSKKVCRTCTVCGYVDEHIHGSATTWTKTADTHKETYNCCGAEKTAEEAHKFGEFKSNNDASFGHDGTKSRTCSVCGYVDTVTETGTKLRFERIDDNYVKILGDTIVGSSDNQCWPDDHPGVFIKDRTVTLSDFIICDHEVTKEEYKLIMSDSKLNTLGIAADPSFSTNKPRAYIIADGEDGNKLPIENVSWYNAVYYCNLLSQKEGFESVYTINNIIISEGTIWGLGPSGTGTMAVKFISDATVTADYTKNGYRLPTEAEWEYAARGGNPNAAAWKYEYAGADSTKTSKPTSDDSALDKAGWYLYNTCNNGTSSTSKPSEGDKGYVSHQVKLKAPNALGLYDMSGNVWEWCYDLYAAESTTGNETNPVGATSGSIRVCRGGSWANYAYYASVGGRYANEPSYHEEAIGFRVVRSVK